jgi:hypothetical protein
MPSVFFSLVDNPTQENKDETGHVNPRIPASSYKLRDILVTPRRYFRVMYSMELILAADMT